MIDILTPKNFMLNGLWFGSTKPKNVMILVHGLFSSAFSMGHVVDELLDADTAVVTFNNRGHDVISSLKQYVGNETKKSFAGTAHEVFTDCVDDIEGAIRRVKKEGVKNIYLAGHSTGCQKITYYAHVTGGARVKGLILLAPLSDWAGERTKPKLRSAVATAKRMMKAGKSHELLPHDAWWHYADAQRFLSLYTPESTEEIFSYAQPDKKPKVYASVTLPVLALFAGADEYADRAAESMVEWFTKHSRSKRFAAQIVLNVEHGFGGGELIVAKAVRQWISA